ncbi:MAG: tellurite resistance TerB family protein [Desulfobulbaceae bacterium]|jgi:uncharacterized membrane protein YebE (DUF533 family)|nr:tellurite resistance TerB family protein [Desulfobulbaceae bacterium]
MAGLTDLLGSLLQGGMAQNSQQTGGGGLNDIIGGLGQMLGGAGGGQQGGAAGGLGNVLGGIAGNRTTMGGLGALAGAIMGGGARGAVGGGALGMLASLAISALQNAGQTPSQTPHALLDAETPERQAAMEADATIIVKAMINAAKADGVIDQQETERIFGKLEEDGLHDEGKQFFLAEAGKPMDTEELVTAAQGRPELAAQIYAASLLTIDVNTPENAAYLRDLSTRLALAPQVTAHIEQSLGIQGI